MSERAQSQLSVRSSGGRSSARPVSARSKSAWTDENTTQDTGIDNPCMSPGLRAASSLSVDDDIVPAAMESELYDQNPSGSGIENDQQVAPRNEPMKSGCWYMFKSGIRGTY